MSYDDLFVVFILSACANVLQFMAHMIKGQEVLDLRRMLAKSNFGWPPIDPSTLPPAPPAPRRDQ